jgi:hypothetical protein
MTADDPRPQADGFIATILRPFAVVWWYIRAFVQVAWPCRFSLGVTLVGMFALRFTDQGRELLIELGNREFPSWPVFAFYLALWVWSVQAWFWGRLMLDYEFGKRPHHSGYRAWLIQQLPRLIALGGTFTVFIGLALEAWRAELPDVRQAFMWHAGATLVVGVVTYVLFLKRRAATARLAIWQRRRIGRNLTAVRGELIAADRRWAVRGARDAVSFRMLPSAARWLIIGTVIVAVALMIWATWNPVGMGWNVGSGGVAFTAFAFIIPAGSLAVWITREQRVPLVSLLLLLCFVFGYFMDNHELRTVEGPAKPPVTVAEAYEKWRETADDRPVVIVATAGGGLRAAYWTAAVLHKLQADSQGEFERGLFAISSVSGGTLGAATYVVARQQEEAQGCVPQGGVPSLAVLRADFLAPTLAAMLYPDLFQRLLPVAVFPDRAAALEEAWERAWISTGRTKDGGDCERSPFAEPFGSLAPKFGAGGAVVPLLLFNGTMVEDGKRIITANVEIDASDFHDAYRLHDLHAKEIRISTAVLNSARFPYVTPVGTLKGPEGTTGHIADGGYFENFGAVTARELVAVIRRIDPARSIVVIQISSDPDLSAQVLSSHEDVPVAPQPPAAASGSNEIYAPIRTIFQTRSGRGIQAAAELRSVVQCRLPAGCPKEGDYAHFRLGRHAGQQTPPLGWNMSIASLCAISDDGCPSSGAVPPKAIALTDNAQEFRNALAALTRR